MKNISKNNGLEFALERYRFLVEQSGDMITTHRPGDWAYTTLNPAVERMMGYPAEDMIGKPAYDFFHPDDALAMKQKLIPAIYKHGSRTFRYRSRHKNGDYQWVESTHRSVRDETTGELVEVIAVTRDISAQVQAEEANQRLAAVVEASSVMVLFCDRHHRVTYLNKAALNQFKIETPLPGCLLLQHLLSPKSYEVVKAVALQLATSNGNWYGSIKLEPKVGSDCYWLLEQVTAPQADTILNEDGDYFSIMIRDLTEQKQAEQTLQDHQQELAHISRLMTMGEMVTGIAHEINQPLASVLNYARGTLRHMRGSEPPTQDRVQGVLERIINQTQLAADIIKRLRSLVKKSPYQRARTDVQALCEEALALMVQEYLGAGIEVECDWPDQPVYIEADKIQIEQVIINILRNAQDAYRDVIREDKRILLQLDADEANAKILVTDFAGGITDEQRQKLFEPYYTSKHGGLGLGLSISRTIIEAHAGTIAVRSVCEPADSSFTQLRVTLPLWEG